MKGIITHINGTFVAVLTDDGDYSVFELLGDDPVDIGDRVSWANDTGFGGERLTNRTQTQTYEVYFQYHHVSEGGLADALN